MNQFLIGMKEGMIEIGNPAVLQPMTTEQAVELAAWLISIADAGDTTKFLEKLGQITGDETPEYVGQPNAQLPEAIPEGGDL